jgi:hypothetical protein
MPRFEFIMPLISIAALERIKNFEDLAKCPEQSDAARHDGAMRTIWVRCTDARNKSMGKPLPRDSIFEIFKLIHETFRLQKAKHHLRKITIIFWQQIPQQLSFVKSRKSITVHLDSP